jgi:ferric-dicitrate binding protein FerR (iron transport regulator)
MKTNHQSDPLDRKIDALLASRPLKPSHDFAARVLARADAQTQADADAQSQAQPQAQAENAPVHSRAPQRPWGKIIAFALPLAAVIALTFSLLHLEPSASEPTQSAELSTAEAQEIFLLQESLAGLATFSSAEFDSRDLLSTLDTLYNEI